MGYFKDVAVVINVLKGDYNQLVFLGHLSFLLVVHQLYFDLSPLQGFSGQ